MPAVNKQKGNLGEAKCLAKMVELGIPVAIPFGDNERYDLIIEDKKQLKKIQVKYSTAQDSPGSIVFKTHSSQNHTTNKNKYSYENDVDGFLFYNGLNGEIYYLPIEIVGERKTVTIRMEPTKNGQTKNCLMAQDYLAEKYFSK